MGRKDETGKGVGGEMIVKLVVNPVCFLQGKSAGSAIGKENLWQSTFQYVLVISEPLLQCSLPSPHHPKHPLHYK